MTSQWRHIWRNLSFFRFIDHRSISRELNMVESQTWSYFEGFNNTKSTKQKILKSIKKWRHNDVMYTVKWHFSDIIDHKIDISRTIHHRDTNLVLFWRFQKTIKNIKKILKIDQEITPQWCNIWRNMAFFRYIDHKINIIDISITKLRMKKLLVSTWPELNEEQNWPPMTSFWPHLWRHGPFFSNFGLKLGVFWLTTTFWPLAPAKKTNRFWPIHVLFHP